MEQTRSPAAPPIGDLDALRSAFERAVQAGDAAAAADAYADDATLVAPAGELHHGRAAIERFWRTGVEIGIDDARYAVIEVDRRGDVIFEVGEYALHSTQAPGGADVSRGRYLIVHRPDGTGRWCRAAEMLSPDQPTGGATTARTSAARSAR